MGWFEGRVASAVSKDRLKVSERVGEFVGIIVLMMMTAFFVYHQTLPTGFFTSKFGSAEMLLFYSPAFFGFLTGGARAIVGRRNIVRRIDMVSSSVWTIACYRLLVVFPFEFEHLADPLPEALRFLLWWVSNDVGRLLLLVGGVGGALGAIYTAVLYLAVRRELAGR
jgi:hypothetical protein